MTQYYYDEDTGIIYSYSSKNLKPITNPLYNIIIDEIYANDPNYHQIIWYSSHILYITEGYYMVFNQDCMRFVCQGREINIKYEQYTNLNDVVQKCLNSIETNTTL